MPTDIFCIWSEKTKLWTTLNSRFPTLCSLSPLPLSFYKLYWDRDHIYLVFVWVVSIQLPLKSLLKQFKAVNKMLDTDERPNAMRFGTQVDCEQCQRKTRQYAREMYARVHIFSTVLPCNVFVVIISSLPPYCCWMNCKSGIHQEQCASRPFHLHKWYLF